MIRAAEAAPIPVPADVAAFAAEEGVGAELPPVLSMTRRLFPRANLRVALEADEEVPNDRHIVLLVRDGTLTAEEALAARWAWHRELFACCPAPLVCTFRLGLELRP